MKKKTCECCGTEYIPRNAKQKYCTRKCYFAIPSQNSFFGKKHSQSSCDKISKANTGKKRSEEYKKARSIANKGKNNPFFGKTHTLETKERIRKKSKIRSVGTNNAFYGKKHTTESRLKISETRSKKIATGEINPINRGIRGYYKNLRFDSIYELGHIKNLELNNNIKSFNRNTELSIKYFWQKSWHKYWPDFMVIGKNNIKEVQEVKGYESKKDKVKHECAKTQLKKLGFKFRVFYKNDIFDSDTSYRSLVREYKQCKNLA